MSEVAFMRLREVEVEVLMKDCGPDSAKLVESEDCEAKVLSVSEVSVLKEAKFNLVKRKRHLIQAVIDGIVDAKSCPTELLRDVAAELVARRKRRKDKAADERRRMLALRGKERFSVEEKQLLWELRSSSQELLQYLLEYLGQQLLDDLLQHLLQQSW